MKNNFLSINVLRCNYFSIQIDTRRLGLLAQNLIWSIWHHNFKSWTALLCNFCNVYHNGSYNWLPRSISSPCSRLLLLGKWYLKLPSPEQFLLLLMLIVVLYYYQHCFQGVIPHCKQCLCCPRFVFITL